MNLKYTGKEIKDKLLENAKFSQDMVDCFLEQGGVKNVSDLIAVMMKAGDLHNKKMIFDQVRSNDICARNWREKAAHLPFEEADVLEVTEEEAAKIGLLLPNL